MESVDVGRLKLFLELAQIPPQRRSELECVAA